MELLTDYWKIREYLFSLAIAQHYAIYSLYKDNIIFCDIINITIYKKTLIILILINYIIKCIKKLFLLLNN